MPTLVEFSQSVYKLPAFDAVIQEFSAEGPDEYGDYTITLKIVIDNETKADWSSLELCAIVLNDSGQQIGGTNTKEDGILAGERGELDISVWKVAAPLLTGDPKKYQALVKLFATASQTKDLGSHPISELNYEITSISGAEIGNELLILGGSLWREEPDSSGDSNIHGNITVQNLSSSRIPTVQFVASITKNGEELFDAGAVEELKLGDIQTIGSYGYSSEDDLMELNADCKIIYSSLVAECSALISGIDIRTTEQEAKDKRNRSAWPSDKNSDMEDSNSDDTEDENVDGGENYEVDLPNNPKEIYMSSNLVFKLVVEDGGKEVFSEPLSYETISNIASSYDDSKDSNKFFALAARHPASSVRENIAYKDNISKEILSLLKADKSLPVLRNLVRTVTFKKNASEEDIERLIRLDVEIAQNIAGDIDSYEQADAGKLCAIILSMEDPSILASLAGNYNTPKKVLKELVNNPDPYVALQAKNQLES